MRLPDGLGYAELVVESGAKSKSSPAELAAYFLGPDARSALTPGPTDVTLDLYLADSKSRKALRMALGPRPADPSGGSRFASPIPEGFDGNITSPRLAATVAGRAIEAP